MARCRHTGKRGNCPKPAIEGSVYCVNHSNEADRLAGYKLRDPELRERFEQLSRDASLGTIRQEVLLLRTLIEDRLNFCNNAAERATALQSVTTSLATIDKLLNSIARLERAASITLDKPALSRLGEKIVDILLRHLDDLPDRDRIVDAVAKEIAQAIVDTRNEQ